MTKKNPAALKLAALSRRKRMKTMTKEQRSEQARRAVACRKDRQKQKAGPWYALYSPTEYPEHPHYWQLILVTQDETEISRRIKEPDLRDLGGIVAIHYDRPPLLFSIRDQFEPDMDAQVLAGLALLENEGGES
jgi:hypothetical protein